MENIILKKYIELCKKKNINEIAYIVDSIDNNMNEQEIISKYKITTHDIDNMKNLIKMYGGNHLDSLLDIYEGYYNKKGGQPPVPPISQSLPPYPSPPYPSPPYHPPSYPSSSPYPPSSSPHPPPYPSTQQPPRPYPPYPYPYPYPYPKQQCDESRVINQSKTTGEISQMKKDFEQDTKTVEQIRSTSTLSPETVKQLKSFGKEALLFGLELYKDYQSKGK